MGGFLGILRNEVNKIISNLDSNKIQLVLGDSSSGKSIILKNIGYKLAQESNVYYIELKRYSTEEIEGFFELIFKEGIQSIIIIDDVHLFAEGCAKLARKFRNSGNGHLIMGSRESLLFRYGPKDFNEFEDITMTRIESKSIAYDIVRLFLSRKHNMCRVPNGWHLYTPRFPLNLACRIKIVLHSRQEQV